MGSICYNVKKEPKFGIPVLFADIAFFSMKKIGFLSTGYLFSKGGIRDEEVLILT